MKPPPAEIPEASPQPPANSRRSSSARRKDEIDPSAPLDVAQLYLAERVKGDSVFDLAFWQGDFWAACGAHYEARSIDGLKADLYPWLAGKHRKPSKDELMLAQATGVAAGGGFVKPNKTLVERVIDALKAAAFLRGVANAPAWIGGGAQQPDAAEIIACRNGLLHVPTRKLLPPTRRFFTLNALDFDFSAAAPAPVAWLQFLDQLWGTDRESIETLQEIFGLALTGDTRHQKAFLLVGPRRCGKGTIARVLGALVGMGNVTAPVLASLGQTFGLESMIGKSLALISDARLGGRADVAAIVESILRITGEDAMSVPRKFKTDWTAPLKARFVILSNELPALLDQSGALAGRFILLRLTQSFFGKEDLALTGKLLEEMGGILLWALAGLDRLRKRGHFIQPASALEMMQQLELLASPIKAFVADRCIVTPGAGIECGDLFKAWGEWTQEQGRDHAGSIQMFGRNLAAAFSGVKQTQPRINGTRERHYEGVRLRTLSDPEPLE